MVVASGMPQGTVTQGNATMSSITEIDVGETLVLLGNLDVNGTVDIDTHIALETSKVTHDEFSVLDGVSQGVAKARKALITNSDKDITGIRYMSLTGIEGNLNINAGIK